MSSPVPPTGQSVTDAGRVLQAPKGVLFSDQPPMTAATLRGLVWAIASIVITGVITVVETQTSFPHWLPIVFVPLIVQVLRTIEGYIDQRQVL